jgi:type I restriction enzyme S subunit
MSKKTHETALPKRRFPEFQDTEAWDIKPLGSVAKLIKEKAGSKQYKLMSITSGAGLVSQMEKFGREIAGASYKNYYVIRKGDFAYNKSSTKLDPEGQIALLENEESGAVPNSIFTCFRVNEQIVSPYFLKYPFANNLHGKWLRDLITVGARVNGALSIDSKHLLALPLALPSLSEQQKIAAALSSLDSLLTAQAAKLTALQAHKRGLMQDLFPAVGETVPKRRFPEFQDADEWEEKKLGDVATFLNGRAYQQAELLERGKYKVLRLGNLFSNNNWYYSDLELEENKYCDNGDLLYAWSASFGPRMWVGEKVIYHYHIWKVLEKEGIGKQFLFILLENETNRIKNAQANGLGMLHITKGSIESWKCLIPKTEEEQRKIATCLSSLDNLITAQSQKIEALKQHKKGLMQALFPAASEPNA